MSEVKLTIRPQRRRRIPSANALVIENIELRLTDNTRRQSSCDLVEGLHRINARDIDENVTTVARLLNLLFKAATLAGSLTSHRTALAFPPMSLINRNVSSALLRSAMISWAPSSPSRTADACPIPDAAPDTTAVFA